MRHIFVTILVALSSFAHAAVDTRLLNQLAAEDSDEKIIAIQKIAQSAEPDAKSILQSLADGNLNDPDGQPITINNRVRREIDGALAVLSFA